jgi:protein associated with RNAse G/E
VFVDDQDEFDENRVEYSYPREVVALAQATRDIVLTAVRDRYPPFDGSATPWFDVLRAL